MCKIQLSVELCIKFLSWSVSETQSRLRVLPKTYLSPLFLLQMLPHFVMYHCQNLYIQVLIEPRFILFVSFIYKLHEIEDMFIISFSCSARLAGDSRSVWSAGVHSSRTQCLWEQVSSADWKHIRLHRHTWSPDHHQLPARSPVQVQLQLSSGIFGQQHTAGLVSVHHFNSLLSFNMEKKASNHENNWC